MGKNLEGLIHLWEEKLSGRMLETHYASWMRRMEWDESWTCAFERWGIWREKGIIVEGNYLWLDNWVNLYLGIDRIQLWWTLPLDESKSNYQSIRIVNQESID